MIVEAIAVITVLAFVFMVFLAPTPRALGIALASFILIFAFLLALIIFPRLAKAEEVRWQQLDGDKPVIGWTFYSVGGTAPLLSVDPDGAGKETVTPQPDWPPTPGPGTPERTVRQYSADLPLSNKVQARAIDDAGQSSVLSNIKQLSTQTPTVTRTATRTWTGTRTATSSPTITSTPTARKPDAPHFLP